LAALAATGVALGSVPPYLTWDLDANRIPLNAEVTWHFLSIAAHAVPSSLALLIGPVQCLPALRGRRPGLHRSSGKLYLLCVLVGGVTSVAAALASTSGLAAQLGFLLLAAAWLWSGAQAYRTARAGRFDLHRTWMIRNYAFTFAAVLLRAFLFAGILYRDVVNPGTSLAFAGNYTSSVWCSVFMSHVAAEWVLVPRTGRPAKRATAERQPGRVAAA
jgi:lysylphosphatidylglycerol synthetase-like protein (DUF2156 family)